jgi:hypothetical protein
MKKQKLKNFLKLGILLFGISLFVVACQKDDDLKTTGQHLEKTNLKINTISSKEIISNDKLTSKLQKFSNTKTTKDNENSQNREVYNTVYDFYIDTDIAKYIETETGHSYTFPVYRNVQNNLTENLLLALQEDGSYKAFLIAYNFTEEQKTQIDNLQNIVGNYDMDITIINEDLSGDILGKMIWEDGCYINRTVYHTNPDGTWVYTGTCPWEAIGNYDYCSSYTIDSVITCNNNSGGGTSTGSGNPNNTNNSPHGSGGGSSNNTSPITCRFCPVLDECPIDMIKNANDVCVPDPCVNLNNQIDPTKANIKPAIIELQGNLNQQGETGKSLKKDQNGVYSNPDVPTVSGLKIKVPFGAYYYGSIHVHPYPIGTPAFSWADVFSLLKFYDNAAFGNQQEVTIVLVCTDNSGVNQVYSLVVDDRQALAMLF